MQAISEFLFKLLVFGQTFFQIIGLQPEPCEDPVRYTLGSIDSRFEITNDEVLSALAQAEKIWEDASGKNLFQYDLEIGLPVRFVYDERQQRTQAGQQLEAKLESLNLEESEGEVTAQVAQYESVKKEYERERTQYENDLNAYNAGVQRAERRGRITESEQEELQDQYNDLQDQFRELEELRRKVNAQVDITNKQISSNQELVKEYNSEVTTFQDLYGGEGEVFDQGVYTGNDITIYQYDDQNRLVMVMAHEMGHALGIDHLENPQSLMHYLMRDQNIQEVTLTEEDVAAVEKACQKPKLFQKNE